MSVIFPTDPVQIKVHPLPKSAGFISYRFLGDRIDLKAWMQDNPITFPDTQSESRLHNEFYDNHCEGCERVNMFYYEKNHGYDWRSAYNTRQYREFKENLPESDCKVYFNGYQGQTCPLGHICEQPEDIIHTVYNLVCRVSLKYDTFGYIESNIHIAKGKVEEDGTIFRTRIYRAANVYGYEYGSICWGDNKEPENMREIFNTYSYSGFNSDLLSISGFVKNSKQSFDADIDVRTEDKFLCSGYDALMFIDGTKDIQAFFTMLMAGFKPFPEKPHIMMIPLEESTIRRNDEIYFGYLTDPDSVGRSWYITPEGVLIGQMDESFAKV